MYCIDQNFKKSTIQNHNNNNYKHCNYNHNKESII